MKGKTVVLASILAMTSSFCLADDTDHPTFIFRSTNGEQIKNLIPSDVDNRMLALDLNLCFINPDIGNIEDLEFGAALTINGGKIKRQNISNLLTSDNNYIKTGDHKVDHGAVLAPGSCTGDLHEMMRITDLFNTDTYYTCHITKESNVASYKPNGANIVDIEANDPVCHFNP